ncbi:MAG: outer membrane lipoprotein-sorting protein [Thermodesulfobacteriota bacterium]|nr:outer membrane lipoprotein-sorting protein [Thermodesulfobacteriota bacterium]
MRTIFLAMLFVLCINGLIQAQEYKIKPGVVITKENYENYLPELKLSLPHAVFHRYVNGLKNGWITMPIVKKEYPPLNFFYLEASKQNKGKFKVAENNKLKGNESWRTGAPFPNPETGDELAWNIYRRSGYLDDLTFYADFLLYDKKANIERSLKWVLRKKMWVGRLEFPPVPEFPGNNGVLNSKECIVILEPFDVKGFCMLRIRYEDIEKPDEVYSYIPAIRRIRRLTGSDVTDPMLGSDCVYDDFETWRQKIDTKMTFNMKKTDKLVGIRVLGDKPEHWKFVRNCYQTEWEVRPFCVLEVNINDPEYAYSKRVIYANKDAGYTLPYADNYDQRGRLLRVCQNNGQSKLVFYKGGWYSDCYWGYTYSNSLTGHSTVMVHYPIWRDPGCTEKIFTFKELLKQAR